MINRVGLYTDGNLKPEDSHRVQSALKGLCHLVSQNWQLPASEIGQNAIAPMRSHIGSQKAGDRIT